VATEGDKDPKDGETGEKGQTQEQFKSEINRKFGNLETQLTDIAKVIQQNNQQNLEIANQLTNPRPQVTETTEKMSDKELEDLFYTDRAAYDRETVKRSQSTLKAEIMPEVKKEIVQNMSHQNKMNETSARLLKDYPDINNRDSDLRKAADSIHDGLPKHLQNTSEGMEVAVLRAASQHGISPQSTKSNQDSFVFGGGTGPELKDQEPVITDQDKALAKKFKIDLSDKKVAEKLTEKKKAYLGGSERRV